MPTLLQEEAVEETSVSANSRDRHGDEHRRRPGEPLLVVDCAICGSAHAQGSEDDPGCPDL